MNDSMGDVDHDVEHHTNHAKRGWALSAYPVPHESYTRDPGKELWDRQTCYEGFLKSWVSLCYDLRDKDDKEGDHGQADEWEWPENNLSAVELSID